MAKKNAPTPQRRVTRQSVTRGAPTASINNDIFSLETLGIVLIVLGGLAVLSVLQPTTDGAPLARKLVGWGALPLGISILSAGIALLARRFLKIPVRWTLVVGAELLLLGSLALSHLWWSGNDPLRAAESGQTGGYTGWAISVLLRELLGNGVAALLLIAWIAGSLWLIFQPTWRLLFYYAAESWDRLRGELPRLDPTTGIETFEAADDLFDLEETPHSSNTRVAAPRARGMTAPTRTEQRQKPVASVNQPNIQQPPQKQKPAPLSTRPEVVPAKRVAPPETSVHELITSSSSVLEGGKLPPLSLLSSESAQRFGDAAVKEMANTIERTLAAFSVPARVVNVNRGPTVTQFGVEPGFIERNGERLKVRVNKIERLSDDLALALAAPSLRIEAPVPGRSYVGIEVPNPKTSMVTLRGVLESAEFRKVGSPLTVAIGKDVSGTPVAYDLGKMPHLLIAGATGSGKSVCINTVITSLLFNNTPDRLRLLMVDPKMVELPIYNGVPHLLAPVVTEMEEAVGLLTWATVQMDDRYRKFSEAGVRNLASYNEKAARTPSMQQLPYIVIIIDELADLMMNAPDDVERHICRLAQMARATGMHLILATQRPSVDVVTGLIKANFPARIAFAVTSQTDSRVILDTPGAEKLLGRGDMLLMTADSAQLRRVQGCYLSDKETERVVEFWHKQTIGTQQPVLPPWAGLMERNDENDELQDAIEAIRGRKRVSTSLLQRQLRIGYPRAARLMEELEAKGYVGPDEGAGRSRLVLLDEEADENDIDTLNEDDPSDFE